jgi:hypothetical protein
MPTEVTTIDQSDSPLPPHSSDGIIVPPYIPETIRVSALSSVVMSESFGVVQRHADIDIAVHFALDRIFLYRHTSDSWILWQPVLAGVKKGLR